MAPILSSIVGIFADKVAEKIFVRLDALIEKLEARIEKFAELKVEFAHLHEKAKELKSIKKPQDLKELDDYLDKMDDLVRSLNI